MTQEIDPRFFLPPNVTGVSYSGTQQPSSDTPVQDNEVVEVEFITETSFEDDTTDISDVPDDDRLLPPDYITVISQTARVNSGGATVVDIVIDVEDSARVSQFEVRVTK